MVLRGAGMDRQLQTLRGDVAAHLQDVFLEGGDVEDFFTPLRVMPRPRSRDPTGRWTVR